MARPDSTLFVFTEKDLKRFWDKVEVKGSIQCWLWKACLSVGGYGVFQLRYKTLRANRVSWMIHHGKIPEGIEVLHNCPQGDNKACVNPKHLYLGTFRENNLDRVVKGQVARGERNGNSTIPDAEVEEMKRRSLYGWTRAEIQRKFGRSKTGVQYALTSR